MPELNINYSAAYSGKPMGGFIPGHTYLIKISENRPYGFEVTTFIDETIDEDFKTVCPYSNLKSIEKYWKINNLTN